MIRLKAYAALFTISILLSSCGLDPNNPEDANLIVNLLKGAEQLNAAMTKDVSIVTDIRDYALSSDAFDQSELLLGKSKKGEAVFKLLLTYAPCFEDNKDEESRIYALERTFANFSFLESHEPIEDLVMDDGNQAYHLTKSDNPVGMVVYTEDHTFVFVYTGKNYDEFVQQNAIEPGIDPELHMFNLENIINEAHEGYCQFETDQMLQLTEPKDEGGAYELSCDVRVVVSKGDCGNGHYISQDLVKKAVVLSAFEGHKMYTLQPSILIPGLYDVFYKDGVKRGFLFFTEDDYLGSILAINHARYIWPETTNSDG
ncbi:MAG: hypothetical protein NXI25_10065 [bacterium]|nr:hypothetical protein [bacterium]